MPWRTITVPAVNIEEAANEYQVTMAAPGMKKNDFNIAIEDNILTISAATENEEEEKDKKYNRKEYSYISFSRSFTLPEEVNREKIEAGYENGLLSVTLPKKEAANVKNNGKKITVK